MHTALTQFASTLNEKPLPSGGQRTALEREHSLASQVMASLKGSPKTDPQISKKIYGSHYYLKIKMEACIKARKNEG
ncbi:hypothetical protein GL2_28130 [Microbulbifer sp. GL-2]|nr:hypothetical protein GL2_28130 [Microbulbifer sp. GL-2]